MPPKRTNTSLEKFTKPFPILEPSLHAIHSSSPSLSLLFNEAIPSTWIFRRNKGRSSRFSGLIFGVTRWTFRGKSTEKASDAKGCSATNRDRCRVWVRLGRSPRLQPGRHGTRVVATDSGARTGRNQPPTDVGNVLRKVESCNAIFISTQPSRKIGSILGHACS